MKLFNQSKADYISPLSQFTHSKAAQKKRIYMKALEEAQQDQLSMMDAGRKILKTQQASI